MQQCRQINFKKKKSKTKNNFKMANERFDYLDAVEGNTMFELTEITQKYSIEETTKLPNGNAIIHRDRLSDKLPDPPSRVENSGRKRLVTMLFILLIFGLMSGLAVPLGLQLRSSSLLEARLAFVRRILFEAPLIQGAGGNASSLAAARLATVTVPCGAQYLDAVQLVLEELDVVQRADEQVLLSSSELIPGEPAVFLGVLGGHAIGDSLGVLRSLHSLGVRFLAPMYGCNTAWANGQIAPSLSEFGEFMIREMNRLGIIIDLTGADEQTALDILETSNTPVIFSEAGVSALCNSSISVSDLVLSRLASNGGVVLIALEQCGETDVDKIIAHIDRIRAISGLAHVGLAAGGDPAMLLAELVRDRHWGTAAVKQLVGGNMLRVMLEVEAHAKPYSTPYEDWMPLDELDGNTYCRYPGI